MKKKRLAGLVCMLTLLLILTGCQCKHEWKNATCTAPKTCAKCGQTEGVALGHTWQAATCTEPQKCSVCGAVNGEALGHKSAGWSEEQTDTVKAISVSTESCEVCGAILSRREIPLKTLHNGATFLLSPQDFVERLRLEYTGVTPEMSVRSGKNGSNFACGFLRDGKQKGFLQFKDSSDNFIPDSSKYDLSFQKLQGTISEDITNALIAIAKSCDPSLDFDAARSVAFEIIANGEAKKNGIFYACQVSNGGGVIWVGLTGN